VQEKHGYKRKIYIINRKFQFKYLFVIVSTMLISVGTVYFTTFYIIWNKVIDEFFYVPAASGKLAGIFLATSGMLVIPLILLAAVFAAAGILLSHKVAGPIFRVERVAEELAKGNMNVKVNFRKGDDLPELAETLNAMIDGIKTIVVEDKKITEKLMVISDRLKENVNNDKGLKQDVKEAVIELNNIARQLKDTTDKFVI
jgi:methyl-accepting chemotaxis protein